MTLESTNGNSNAKQKPSLKKEELEQIAKQLKRKLSKASIAAKQSISPSKGSSSGSAISSSPLAYNIPKRSSPGTQGKLLSSSPGGLYSPNGISPIQSKSSSGVYLNSSPLKRVSDSSGIDESPTKKKDSKGEPQMILEHVTRPNTPSKKSSASESNIENDDNSSPPLEQTTPTLPKKQAPGSSGMTPLLRTPTQSRGNTSGSYKDEEGADLLMYLATSPSPAKPYFSNTPKSYSSLQHGTSTDQHASSGSGQKPGSPTNSSTFIAPPPLTPKRHFASTAKTPQNKLTPSVNLFNALNSNSGTGLPSSGLSLTPAGFNMNDYVNFFTPSPGAANAHSGGRTYLRTPDYNNLISNTNSKQRVDGKMINFDKVLFGNANTNNENLTKE